MKYLFPYIASKAKKRNAFEQSEEFHFFLANRHLLMRLPHFVHFYDQENDPFDIMRANIILYAYLNKNTLDNIIL